MEQHFNEREFDTALDALMAFMDCLPKSTVKMIRPSRYQQLMKTAAQLTDLLRKTKEEGELTVNIDNTFNLGSISVELDDLSVDDPQAFAKLIAQADNFEIYPLTNGNICLEITFQGVLKTIA